MGGTIPGAVWGDGWGENKGPAYTSVFPPLSGTPSHPPSLPSSLHCRRITFLQFPQACGPVSFHSAQIFLLTSLSLLALFSIHWLFPSGCQLWTSSPPTLSRICFFRNGIQLEAMQRALRWLFSFTGWDHTYWTGWIYHTVKHLPTYAPSILNNNQEEFADAHIRI